MSLQANGLIIEVERRITNYSRYMDYHGKPVTIIRPLTDKEADIFDVGPMYKVKADDGTLMDAFEDELELIGGKIND